MSENDSLLERRLAGELFTREDLERDTIIGRRMPDSLITSGESFSADDLRRDTVKGWHLPRDAVAVEGISPAIAAEI